MYTLSLIEERRVGKECTLSLHDALPIYQDADLWLAKLGVGNKVSHTLAAGRHAWLHVAEGEVTFDGQKLSGGDAVAIDEAGTVELSATKPSQVLLFDLN